MFLVVVSVAVATDFVGAVAGFLMFSFYLNFRFAYCFAFSFKTFSLGLAWLGAVSFRTYLLLFGRDDGIGCSLC